MGHPVVLYAFMILICNLKFNKQLKHITCVDVRHARVGSLAGLTRSSSAVTELVFMQYIPLDRHIVD